MAKSLWLQMAAARRARLLASGLNGPMGSLTWNVWNKSVAWRRNKGGR